MVDRVLAERVAAAEEQLEILDREMLRVRSRLHDIEADRATIRLLLEQVQSLGMRISEVAGSIETVAQRAAEKTVALAFADQNKIAEMRSDNRRDRLKTSLQALAVGISAGGFVSAIVFQLVFG